MFLETGSGMQSSGYPDPNCLDILLVEDASRGTGLVAPTLRELQPSCSLHVVNDVEQALYFLYRSHEFADAPTPHLIVLDWDLGPADNDKLLAMIKGDPELSLIPVIVLSDSSDDENVLKGYELFASCWVVKAQNRSDQAKRLRSLIEFWFRTAQLPRHDRRFHSAPTR